MHFKILKIMTVDIVHCVGRRVRKRRRKILPGPLNRSLFFCFLTMFDELSSSMCLRSFKSMCLRSFKSFLRF